VLNFVRIGFGALLLVKLVDIVARGAERMPLWVTVLISVLWGAAAIALVVGFAPRLAAALILSLIAWLIIASQWSLFNQHLYLIASIAAILALRVEVTLLLRLQLSIVYAFATAAKLNETFLSGTVLYVSVVQRPFWQTLVHVKPPVGFLIGLSCAVVVAEAVLSFGFWLPRFRWVALTGGVLFQLVTLAMTTRNVISFDRLLVFGGLLVLLYLAFFPDELDRSWSRTTGRLPRRGGFVAGESVRLLSRLAQDPPVSHVSKGRSPRDHHAPRDHHRIGSLGQ
jgi:hypothetical protein